MMLYPSICYLQNHKTGSTLVEEFLKTFCTENLQQHSKHAALPRRPPGRFCFTNVREPLALYRSLFAYGLDGKGTVYLRLRRLGFSHLYSHETGAFAGWLDFITSRKNAGHLDADFAAASRAGMGLMTWRFLRLACPGLQASIADLCDQGPALKRAISDSYCLDGVIRQEQLTAGLKALALGPLAGLVGPEEAVLAWLEEAPRVNASSSRVADRELPGALLSRVLEQETLLYRNFYPSDAARIAALVGEVKAHG